MITMKTGQRLQLIVVMMLALSLMANLWLGLDRVGDAKVTSFEENRKSYVRFYP